WILFQIVMFAAGGEDRISWACHIGGILAGFVLVLVLRSRGVPLLAGADGEPDPTPNIQQPPVPVEPAASDGTPAQPGSQWGRGAATPRD
ncbi:MAG: rhomboid family intramembrane serine protease, partial [Mesorhizobium sp.]